MPDKPWLCSGNPLHQHEIKDYSKKGGAKITAYSIKTEKKVKTKQKLYTIDICSILHIGQKWEYMTAGSHTNEQVSMNQVVNAAYLANEAWEA